MLYPGLNVLNTYKTVTDIFRGYRHNLNTMKGEFYETKNLTSDFYPILASRQKRGLLAKLNSPCGLAVSDGIVWADGANLFLNGEKIQGVVLSTLPENNPKRIVCMGAYICVFPDNIYVNSTDLSDYGSMEMHWESPVSTTIKYILSDGNGKAYDKITVSKKEPEKTVNGDYWLDTSGDLHALKQYSESMKTWVETATVYVKIEAAGIGQRVKDGDGVRISGVKYSGKNEIVTKQAEALNGTLTVKSRGDNFIVVTGIIDETFTQTAAASAKVEVSRKVPKMDFVTECQNRLWGCYYGIENGKAVNEIFCCKLGDFKNWECYAGLSTDSFRASCGTDGVWTGAITYLGYPMFFKENYVHKVYISAGGAHHITASAIDGVQKGSDKSLCIVDDRLFYKSVNGVKVFDGAQAVDIGEALGEKLYFNAVGGRLGRKYYISMCDSDGRWELFNYDNARHFWMHEDSTHVMDFADSGSELFYTDAADNMLKSIRGLIGVEEKDFEWEAESGTLGFSSSDKKYVSRLNFRMRIEEGGFAEVFICYDSCGIWEKSGAVTGTDSNRTFIMPVIPRRCDHMSIKIRGKGEFRLYSVSGVIRKGSDV